MGLGEDVRTLGDSFTRWSKLKIDEYVKNNEVLENDEVVEEVKRKDCEHADTKNGGNVDRSRKHSNECRFPGHGEAGIGTTLTRGAVVVVAAYGAQHIGHRLGSYKLAIMNTLGVTMVSHMLEEICMAAFHKAT
uniref:Uncharacterized protein n=1 Tax=Tanacetum cinerariifolium TaxID=118510 RepID=A0A6L2LKC6_TANCI|nr:hypothetical protein [Tanacetum cinerariifolium]